MRLTKTCTFLRSIHIYTYNSILLKYLSNLIITSWHCLIEIHTCLIIERHFQQTFNRFKITYFKWSFLYSAHSSLFFPYIQFSLHLTLSLSLSLSLSVYLSLFHTHSHTHTRAHKPTRTHTVFFKWTYLRSQSRTLYVNISMPLFFLSVCLNVCLSVSLPPLSLSLSLSLCLSISLSHTLTYTHTRAHTHTHSYRFL